MKSVLCAILAVILCAAIPMIALASSDPSQSYTVYGYIGITPINVTVSPISNLGWTADADSDWAVTSKAKCYLINNDETVKVKVELVAFEHDLDVNDHANVVKDDLTLILTGDLAIAGNPNLAEGWDDGEIYDKLLVHGDDWEFGFSGEYTGLPLTAALHPQYAMTFEFDIAN